MTWEVIDDPKFLARVLLVDMDLWPGGCVFPADRVEERVEFWDKQAKKFYDEMLSLGNGHFTWQLPSEYINPADGRRFVTHSTPQPHAHYYVGKPDDGYQFRIPIY